MAVTGWRRPWSAQPFGDASASPLWIARKLVGAWGFDGSLPGRNIADSPGLGDLTGSNATRTGSPYGAATALNGSSAYLTNTANSAVTQLPVTFFARVYIGATKQARIFDISTGTTANDVIGLQQNNTELRAQHYDGGGEGYAGINNAGNIGRWITVAGVFDGLASRAIYVDGGDQVATNATALSAPSGINRVTIGYAPWGSSEYFNGTVSHALLFASALTAAEIKALHLDTLQVLAPRRIWVPVSAGGGAQTVAIGQASETDTAQAFTGTAGAVVAIGQASETDTAQALTTAQAAAIGQAQETDLAQALTTAQAKAIGQAQETDTAQALTSAQAATIGQASETDEAQAVTYSAPGAIAQASETDEAQPMQANQVLAIGQALETDSAGAMTYVSGTAIGMALEIDTAGAFAAQQAAAIGQATETDTAQALTVGSTGGGTGASAADVWDYMLSNGKTAEENVVEIHAMLSLLTTTTIADAVWAKVLP